MINSRIILSAIVLIFFLSACGKKSIEGEVFIVTLGGDAVPLPLVEVEVYTERDVSQFLNGLKPQFASQIQSLELLNQPIFEQCREKNKFLLNEADRLNSEWMDLPRNMKCRGNRTCTDEERSVIRRALLAKATQADERHMQAVERCLHAIPSIVEYRKLTARDEVSLWSEFKASPVAVRKTGANGRFDLELDGSYKRVALFANGRRTIGDANERYHWRVWIDLNSRTPTEVMLANDNVVMTACKGCIRFALGDE